MQLPRYFGCNHASTSVHNFNLTKLEVSCTVKLHIFKLVLSAFIIPTQLVRIQRYWFLTIPISFDAANGISKNIFVNRTITEFRTKEPLCLLATRSYLLLQMWHQNWSQLLSKELLFAPLGPGQQQLLKQHQWERQLLKQHQWEQQLLKQHQWEQQLQQNLVNPFLILKAHSHDVRLMHEGVADRYGAEKQNFFYFLWHCNSVPQPHVDSQQICSHLNEP